MKKFFLFLFIFSLSADLKNLKISAKSAILINTDTGAVLYEKHAHVPMYPASTTKIATALYALELGIDHNSPMKVSKEALKTKSQNQEAPAYWGEADGSKMGLVVGEILPFESLLHGLMRVSGNDAANVIAENLASSIPDFVLGMNEYVQSLGCINTQFKNPHGLHHEEHVSTAFDLSLIAKRAFKLEKLVLASSNIPYTKPKTNKQPGGELAHASAMLRPGKYFYSKAGSVKTGYHSKAAYTLVATAKNEGRNLILVLLGCDTSQSRYKDAAHLFENAFKEHFEKKTLFKAFSPFHHQIPGLSKPFKSTLLSDLAITYYPSEEPACRAFIHWNDTLPVAKGQVVGTLQIHDVGGNVIQTGELISMEEVKPTLLNRLKTKLFRNK